MTLIDLKSSITNKIVPSDFMIFINKDNPFLASQYIKALGELAPGGINKISSIYEPQQSSIMLLTSSSDALNILTVDVFDERSEDYTQFENTIVVCEQVDKSILKSVESYIIKFPKLEEWQIFDYAKTLCPELDADELTWLIKVTNNNIDRIINELSKVTLFNKAERKEVFNSIRFDSQSDLYNLDIFKIVNAIIEGDNRTLFEFLVHKDYESIDPVMLANRALNSLKNIILITQNSNLSAEDCGVSANQYRFIKYNYRNLNVQAVREKIKFLSNFDLLLKTSRLELPKHDMLNYLISHLTYKITF